MPISLREREGGKDRTGHEVALLDPVGSDEMSDELLRDLLQADDVRVRCLQVAQDVRNAIANDQSATLTECTRDIVPYLVKINSALYTG